MIIEWDTFYCKKMPGRYYPGRTSDVLGLVVIVGYDLEKWFRGVDMPSSCDVVCGMYCRALCSLCNSCNDDHSPDIWSTLDVYI